MSSDCAIDAQDLGSVTLAHDYLTQRGGAERVVLALAAAFPDARILTTAYDAPSTYPEFRDRDIDVSFLNRSGFVRRHIRIASPLLPLAVRELPAAPGVVIASSSGWGHAVRSIGPKVVYCHNPARWLYQSDDYFSAFPAIVRLALRPLLAPLRRWDKRKAQTAALYVANSTNVAGRIRDAYGISAAIVFPPPGVEPNGPLEPVPGLAPGFFLSVGRRRGYKNVQSVCEAVELDPAARLVCVGGLPRRPAGTWSPRITGLTGVPDTQMRWLYSNAAAVVAVAHEDFGLTPLEGHAFGTPSVVLRAGGYLDSCVEGVTSRFVESDTVNDIADGLRAFRADVFDSAAIRNHARLFSSDAFANAIREAVQSVIGRACADNAVPARTSA
jgi:glycosyltransferase involved in cell wall biosynthesis